MLATTMEFQQESKVLEEKYLMMDRLAYQTTNLKASTENNMTLTQN